MATERRTWATERTWAIKGVSDRTRAAALAAAHEAGLTIGQWLEQTLARAAAEARHPKPLEAAGAEIAEPIDERLKPIEEALGRLTERLAALEERVGQRTEPGPVAERADVPSPNGAPEMNEQTSPAPTPAVGGTVPGRRRLPEHLREKIEELHRAGRSAYAISKELGVPYTTVHKRVKALAGRE
jgi:hypothetical protein